MFVNGTLLGTVTRRRFSNHRPRGAEHAGGVGDGGCAVDVGLESIRGKIAATADLVSRMRLEKLLNEVYST